MKRRNLALVYLNDVFQLSATLQQHIRHVRKAFQLLHSARATLGLKICKFFMETIRYLNHVISLRRLELGSHMTDAICGLKPPTNITEPRSYLEYATYSNDLYQSLQELRLRLIDV